MKLAAKIPFFDGPVVVVGGATVGSPLRGDRSSGPE
jgi:hypothetical protein